MALLMTPTFTKKIQLMEHIWIAHKGPKNQKISCLKVLLSNVQGKRKRIVAFVEYDFETNCKINHAYLQL